MKILPHLCLELPVQEAYLPRPECTAVEIDWQLLIPVTTVPLYLYVASLPAEVT